MCGVFAWLSPAQGPAHTADVRARMGRALHALRHRGPDGEGHAIQTGTSRLWHHPQGSAQALPSDAVSRVSGTVALGHTRLAIRGGTSGAQPLADTRRDVTVVVNGELYTTPDVLDGLRKRYAFDTTSDAEIALALYAMHGARFAAYLRGEFAIVLHDARRGRVFAVRDRFGIKPLVWTRVPAGGPGGGGVALASEAKALFAAGLRAPVLDLTTLWHACAHQYPPPTRSFFAHVWQVEPGCMLTFDVRAPAAPPVRWRYADAFQMQAEPAAAPIAARDTAALNTAALNTAAFNTGAHTADTHTAHLRSALTEAVTLRAAADVPIAVHLSGGLDSTLITALLRDALAAEGRPLPRAFAVAFEGPLYGEGKKAEAAAAALGVPLTTVPLGADALWDSLGDAVFFSEGLCINGQLPAKLALARAIRAAGFGVSLSGEGADELFWGYAHLHADAYAAGLRDTRGPAPAAQAGIMLAAPGAPRGLPTFLAAKAAFGARLFGADTARPTAHGPSPTAYDLAGPILDPDALAPHPGADPLAILLAGFDVPDALSLPARAAALWTTLTLGGYILRTLGDGTEMAASIEGRPPFLDDAVVAAAGRLTAAQKLAGPLEKHVLRTAFSDVLPDAVRAAPKHPFLAPPVLLSAHRRANARWRHTWPDALHRAGLPVNTAALRARLDLLASAPNAVCRAWEPPLMLLASAAALMTRFDMRATQHGPDCPAADATDLSLSHAAQPTGLQSGPV